MDKFCSKCQIERNHKLFYKDKRSKDGLRSWCNKCLNEDAKKFRKKNFIHVHERDKKYRSKNETLRKQLMKKWHKNNTEYEKIYREENKKRIDEYRNCWLEKNPNYKKEWARKSRKENIQVRLKNCLRSRLKSAIKNNPKKGSAIRDLGCSVYDLKFWLEFWFDEGMSWDNYGNKPGQWSIDHIKPLSKFDLTQRSQLLEACNYKNLQPMWHIDNMKKGAKW